MSAVNDSDDHQTARFYTGALVMFSMVVLVGSVYGYFYALDHGQDTGLQMNYMVVSAIVLATALTLRVLVGKRSS